MNCLVLSHTLYYADNKKDLGINYNDNLTSDVHMDEKVNKASMVLGLIHRTFTYFDNASLIQLYKPLKNLTYMLCIILRSPTKKKNINLIDGEWKRITKFVDTLRILP